MNNELNIQRPQFKKVFIIDRQSAGDISKLIVKGIRESLQQAKNSAHQFTGTTQKQTARNLWMYLKHNLKYKAESLQNQTVKTLARIYNDKNKGNDCKHFTTFISTYAITHKIPVKLRLVSFNKYDKTPTHIYPVLTIQGKEVPVDAVINQFGVNPKGITYFKDIKLN